MLPQFEKVPQNQKTSFVIREFKLPRFDAPLHFHPELELTLILNGQGKRVVGDHITDFFAGDLVLIGPNVPHYWYSHRDGTTDLLAHSIVIQFSENFLGDGFFRVPEMATIGRLLEKSRRGISVDETIREEITLRMYKLLKLQGTRRIFEMLSILDLLASTEAHTFLASNGFNLTIDRTDCERINKVCQYVFENFSEEVHVSEAASLINMSTPAFCFYFKKRTRRNFSQFVNEIRVGHACRLLIETSKSISEICYESGFKNLSNFNRRFKELQGMAPSQYRQQI